MVSSIASISSRTSARPAPAASSVVIAKAAPNSAAAKAAPKVAEPKAQTATLAPATVSALLQVQQAAEKLAPIVERVADHIIDHAGEVIADLIDKLHAPPVSGSNAGGASGSNGANGHSGEGNHGNGGGNGGPIVTPPPVATPPPVVTPPVVTPPVVTPPVVSPPVVSAPPVEAPPTVERPARDPAAVARFREFVLDHLHEAPRRAETVPFSKRGKVAGRATIQVARPGPALTRSTFMALSQGQAAMALMQATQLNLFQFQAYRAPRVY